MEEPPILLDGARVLEYAVLDHSGREAGRARGLAAGVPVGVEAVSRLVIAENLVEEGVFLMHCGDEWVTVIGESYPDPESARVAADEAYGGRAIPWVRFRELTAQEAKEVEITRSFLREITAEFPPG
ncbi:MAG TPA: hypothetical protein VLS49_13585 [Usitatibacter sp.]|nr:hypothetical protein [Usitatibacter sp.]